MAVRWDSTSANGTTKGTRTKDVKRRECIDPTLGIVLA
jgi:hypothetical protein